jgi:acetylornithine deacetylase/succinyl-diaminopimelate desuccinylase-like protein
VARVLFTLLEQLVSIPSPTGQETQLAAWCENFLSQSHFNVQRQWLPDGRFNILAESSGTGPELILYAHLDTVHPDPNWEDPFQLQQRGDHLLGLGVSDMKGGLAVILHAAQNFSARGCRLKIALGVDEEQWSAGAWTLLRSGWLAQAQLILVPELSIDSPALHLGLGRRGCFSYQLDIEGIKRHGALQSLNAIQEGAHLIQALSHREQRPHPHWGTEDILFRAIQAESTELSVPACCRIVFSCFTHPGRSSEAHQKQLQQELERLSTARLKLSPLERPTPGAPGYWIDSQHPQVRRFQTQISKIRGTPLPEVMGVSVADENVLALSGVPVLSLAPTGGNSHRHDEWLSAASLQETSTLFQALLDSAAEWLG